MRSSAILLALACACGNLSNEDIAFLEAIPQKDQLHVKVPEGDAAQPACAIGAADIWIGAKSTGDNINQGVDGILSFVDTVRTIPPTTRDPDTRTWGPFPDGNHPGVDIQITMFRDLDASLHPWRWIYTIAARRKPADFVPILEGEFFGAQAKNGIGRLTMHFENMVALGINKPADPTAAMRIFYDLASDPHTISLDTTASNGFGLARFDYGWAGYADGHGRFDYAIPDKNGTCTVEITAFFTAQGAGRDVFRARCPNNLVIGDIQQCWDKSACLTYVNDPFAFTTQCNGVKPCLLGSAGLCVN